MHALLRSLAIIAVLLVGCGGGESTNQADLHKVPLSIAQPNGNDLTDEQALRYIASYPDLIAAFGLNLPLAKTHWASVGRSEGRVLTFDELKYIASYSDLIASFGLNTDAAIRHYITSGVYEGRKVTFDAGVYIASSADLIQAFGTDYAAATRHYIVAGFQEGRPFTFDPLRYVASYADLISTFGTDVVAATKHYIVAGYYEGRELTFNALAYIASYVDLIYAFGTDVLRATAHFISNGFAEGRATVFNAQQYLANYADLRAAFGTNEAAATAHYITNGFAEQRSAFPIEVVKDAAVVVSADVPETARSLISRIGGVEEPQPFNGSSAYLVRVAESYPLVVASSATGQIVLAAIGSDSTLQLSVESTAVALVRMLMEEASLDGAKAFLVAAIKGDSSFGLLLEAVNSALSASKLPSEDETTLRLASSIASRAAKGATEKVLALAEVANRKSALASRLPVVKPLPYVALAAFGGNIEVSGGLVELNNRSLIRWAAKSQDYYGQDFRDGRSEVEILSRSNLRQSLAPDFLYFKKNITYMSNDGPRPFVISLGQNTTALTLNVLDIIFDVASAVLDRTVFDNVSEECAKEVAGLFMGPALSTLLATPSATTFEEAFDQMRDGGEKALIDRISNPKAIEYCTAGVSQFVANQFQNPTKAKTTYLMLAARMSLIGKAAKFILNPDETAALVAIPGRIAMILAYHSKPFIPVTICVANAEINNCAHRFDFSPINPTILAGSSHKLETKAYDVDKRETPRPSTAVFAEGRSAGLLEVDWKSGRFTALKSGFAELAVADPYTGASGATGIFIESGRLYPSEMTVRVGEVADFKLVSNNGNDFSLPSSIDMAWSTANSAIASVVSTGSLAMRVKGEAPGRTSIQVKNPVTGVILTATLNVEIAGARNWIGRLESVGCVISDSEYPPAGLSFFWEYPCANTGIIDFDNYSGTTFYLNDANGKLVMQSTLSGERLRAVFNAGWSFAQSELKLSIPTKVAVPNQIEQKYNITAGSREFTLTITERLGQTVKGRFSIKSKSGVAFQQLFGSRGEGATFYETTSYGVWRADITTYSPATEMFGMDLCSDLYAGRKYLDVETLSPSTVSGNSYSRLMKGPVGGHCQFE